MSANTTNNGNNGNNNSSTVGGKTGMELIKREDNYFDNRNGNGALRNLVSSNTGMMHKVGSRLGELGAVRKEVVECTKQVVMSNQAVANELQVIAGQGEGEKAFLTREFKKVVEAVVVAQKNTGSIHQFAKKESEAREKFQKEAKEEIKKLSLQIDKKVKKQRYLWASVGVLLLSLVLCLGYIAYTVSNLNVTNNYANEKDFTKSLETAVIGDIVKKEAEKPKEKGSKQNEKPKSHK